MKQEYYIKEIPISIKLQIFIRIKIRGRLAIKRDYNKTTLTLVTCTNNDSSTQTIYIAELLRVE